MIIKPQPLRADAFAPFGEVLEALPKRYGRDDRMPILRAGLLIS